MNNFSYNKVTEVAEAVADLTGHTNARFIAGGTNLLDLMKENVAKPDHLTDINKLALAGIEATEDGGLSLGALATNADTAWNELVEQKYPLLSQAILAGASPQLRNMATNGGNLFQRTRCYYFYDTATACNKREPGSGCSAINGINRIHAILGTSEHCIATHPSDMCVALAALNAKVNVTGPYGDRVIEFRDFHRLPGDTPHLDNNVQDGELVTSIDLPPSNFTQHFHYLKVRERQSYAFALVSVAAALELDGNVIKDIRLALGGVAHKPWRDRSCEEAFIGQEATEANFRALAEKILADAKGYGSNTFKIDLAKRAIVRAFSEALKNN
ncbi:FAD binding domain-containing protein [Dyadobacter sediminis]|uniref:Xanthine dehydrogenase family protein subunit M n=1 Tax=Dyadobacter sediminis TaxID=1493691 RepID=A0A5R9KKZ9_9BACT|nr:xanthine dehydrogenase family protein subunit M [Dyadobacter sediminis]TLU96888.1 xanthine dehydrogenase family protein subunit M [Dyadobacter sediminis]GGB85983.1 FAD-binding molybdopterin dehydrogenase [Dyadobacter sediminis]